MKSIPATIAEAIAEIDRVKGRLDDYRAQLDNTFAMLQSASGLAGRLGTELRHTAAELESVRAERDYWRAQASARTSR